MLACPPGEGRRITPPACARRPSPTDGRDNAIIADYPGRLSDEYSRFPRHMASARKQAAKTMAHIDVVIEVLDARIPAASRNPMIDELRTFRQRPCLKLLNKADAADPPPPRNGWRISTPSRASAVALSCSPGDVAKNPLPRRKSWRRTAAMKSNRG